MENVLARIIGDDYWIDQTADGIDLQACSVCLFERDLLRSLKSTN